MPIAVSCPKCNRKYQVRDELAGKTAKCQCGQPLPIPQPAPKGVASLLDEENLGPLAPADPFAGLPADVGAATGPLPPVGTLPKKHPQRTTLNPTLIWVLVGAGAACVIGGVVLLAVNLLGGSGGPRTKTPDAVAAAPRSKTPEEVFAACRKAINDNDWRACYDLYCPATQDQLAAGAVGLARMLASDVAAFGDVCKKYGLAPLTMQEMMRVPSETALRDQMLATARQMSDSKKADLFVAVFEILNDDKRLPNPVPPMVKIIRQRFELERQRAQSSTLSDVRIDGDRASATVKYAVALPEQPGKITEPIEFVKIDGQWRLMEKAEKGAANGVAPPPGLP
jgi:hypothetical protein